MANYPHPKNILKYPENFRESDYNFSDDPIFFSDLQKYARKTGDVMSGSFTFLHNNNFTAIDTFNEINTDTINGITSLELTGYDERITNNGNNINVNNNKLTDINYSSNVTTISNELNIIHLFFPEFKHYGQNNIFEDLFENSLDNFIKFKNAS